MGNRSDMRSLWLCVGDRLGEQEGQFRMEKGVGQSGGSGVERIAMEAQVHGWDLPMWDPCATTADRHPRSLSTWWEVVDVRTQGKEKPGGAPPPRASGFKN